MDKLDGELRQRAARYKGSTGGEILSVNELRQASRMLDPEIAAMLFYQSVLESRFDKDFISLVNGTKLELADKEFNRKTEVAFIPSVFANSGLKWGADGEKILDGARSLGFQTETVETYSSSTLVENAVVIGKYLRECSSDSIILVSRNRASAEVRLLLQHSGIDAAGFSKLKGWISITGIVNGSQQLGRIAHDQSDSLVERLTYGYYRVKSVLARENNLAIEQAANFDPMWSQEFKLPAATSFVQILGIARPRHLSSGKKILAETLQKSLGPNDGTLFVEESWHKQGLRYPLWGLHSSSSYLSYKNVLERILLTVMQGQKVLSTHNKS